MALDVFDSEIEREPVEFRDRDELAARPVLDAVRRAHQNFERSSDTHLDLGLRHGEPIRREPALDMIGGTPGREDEFAGSVQRA